MKTMTKEDSKAVELAIGRILRLGSRPFRKGDIEDYERCREIIMELCGPTTPDYTPNYARDRLCGAAGD